MADEGGAGGRPGSLLPALASAHLAAARAASEAAPRIHWGRVVLCAACVLALLPLLRPLLRRALGELRRLMLLGGFTPKLTARSLSLGFLVGIQPLYVPVLPTLVFSALARWCGHSAIATALGINLATPLMFCVAVPYIVAGSAVLRVPVPDIAAIEELLRESPVQGLERFGACVLAGEFAWALTAPAVLAATYVIFLLGFRLLQGRGVAQRGSDCELGKTDPMAAMMPAGRS